MILKDSPDILAEFSNDELASASLLENVEEDQLLWALVVEQVRPSSV